MGLESSHRNRPPACSQTGRFINALNAADPRERVLLPADLPAVHQLGVRTHRLHARPGALVRPNQPVTPIVNAIRDLFTRQPVGSDIWTAHAWFVGIVIIAFACSMVIYRRKIS